MDMSRVALLNMLRPLMAQETQGQVNRLLNNMQFSGDMDLYEMKLSAHRNRRVTQMKKDKKLPYQLKAQEDWDKYTWGQRSSKTRGKVGKRNGGDQNRQNQKPGKGKRNGMNSRRGKNNNNPSGGRQARSQGGGRQNNRRQNRQNGGANNNPQGQPQQNGGTLRRNFNNNPPTQAEG